MPGSSIKKHLAMLWSLERRRAALLADVLQDTPLVVGTVSAVRARCGKPGCHCAQGPGHPQVRLLYAEGGRRRCKLIRQADVDELRRAGERYRDVKRLLRTLTRLQLRQRRLLRTLVRQRGLRYR
jgi:hypothetical protein